MKQAIQKLMDERAWNQSHLAKELGVSSAQISLYFKGEYKGDVAKLESKIKALLKRFEAKNEEENFSLTFVETSISKSLFSFFTLTHLDKGLGVAFGEAGLGKTQSMKAYFAENPGTILIETDPTFTAKRLIQSIAKALGASNGRTIAELFDGCVDALKGTSRLLMIDEAELLPYRALELLRRLHDKAESPIILCGMPKLMQNLRGSKNQFKQLYSRIDYKCELKDCAEMGDIEKILKASFSNQMMERISIKEIASITHHNLRHLSKLLRCAHRLAHAQNIDISSKLLSEAKAYIVV